MLQPFFQTFKSPYRLVTFRSSKYRQVLPYFITTIIVAPLLFLLFKSFLVFLAGQIAVFIIFPVFIWIYLNTDELTDIKLDIIKIFVIISLYFSYLLGLTWIMLFIFKPTLKEEYVFLNLGYLGMLFMIAVPVIIVCFYHRYAKKRRKKV